MRLPCMTASSIIPGTMTSPRAKARRTVWRARTLISGTISLAWPAKAAASRAPSTPYAVLSRSSFMPGTAANSTNTAFPPTPATSLILWGRDFSHSRNTGPGADDGVGQPAVPLSPLPMRLQRADGRAVNHLGVPTDIALLVVLWRLRYKLSPRDLAEMFLTRCFTFIHEGVRTWEEHFALNAPIPLAEQRQLFHGRWARCAPCYRPRSGGPSRQVGGLRRADAHLCSES